MTELLDPSGNQIEVKEIISETTRVTEPWVKLIYVIGVPSVIALYLVYQFTTTMQADIKQLNLTMPLHVQATDKLNGTSKEILSVLQRICVNSAKSNQDRSNCFLGDAK